MVMITGIGVFFSSFCVCALNALQNSMMLRPRCASAGPIGGDGLAAPAGTCNFRYPVTFFAICHSCCADRDQLFQVSWFGSKRLATALTSHGLSRKDALCAFAREMRFTPFPIRPSRPDRTP